MTTLSQLQQAACAAATRLRETQTQLVLAESCTGGLVSASLTGVPGISQYLCGSFVVYQTGSKQHWLGVDATLLATEGPVCQKVVEQLAAGALQKTDQAQLAVTITGHLGPNAPDGMDGLVFIGVGHRTGDASQANDAFQIDSKRIVLPIFDSDQRIHRQRLAAIKVLETIAVSAISSG